MGWLQDMKAEIDVAKASRDQISPVAAPRIDTVVADPASGEPQHRTDYAGTVWYGGRPLMNQPRLAGLAEITTPFWLPDSHGYEPGAAGSAQIQASAAVQSVWIQSAGGGLQILEVSAALGEHPENRGALLVYMAVIASAELPLGVAYRVTVICAPAALRPPAA